MLTTAGTSRRILIAIAACVVSFTFCRGGEPTEVAALRLHRVRAADAQAVADLVAKKVTAERVLLVPGTRQLAVLAVPSKQSAVAEEITAHEKEAILFERIELNGSNLADLERRLKAALLLAARETEWKPLRVEWDMPSNALNVWARDSQINFVEQFVRHSQPKGPHNQVTATDAPQAAKRTSPTRPLESPPPDGPEAVHAGERFPDDGGRWERTTGLPLPRGPVRIVLIKELDLVLIRASGQSLGNGMRQLPVPSGDVKINSGRASDR